MRYILYSFVIAFGLSTNSCTLFKKNISKPVTIALPDTLFNASITSTAMYTKYTNTITSQQVVSSFLKGFIAEGKNTNNVKFQFGTENADYILKLKFLKVEEKSNTEKINDPKSPYNGQEVLLNSVTVTAEFDVFDPENSTKILNTCNNNKERSERESSNRDLGDLVTGTNKDHTKYHTKLLADNIAITLSEDVGRRIWVPITRRVGKQVNK